jgi:hypothetical protein
MNHATSIEWYKHLPGEMTSGRLTMGQDFDRPELSPAQRKWICIMTDSTWGKKFS